MDREAMIDYLIEVGEAVEWGERWTGDTTHEWWWTDKDKTSRDYRLVATYHGTGARGDDDEAEYAQRLRDLGRAVLVADDLVTPEQLDAWRADTISNITHVVMMGGKVVRIRNYFHTAAPEGRY